MTVKQVLDQITERQISDATMLRRVVALFQRELGKVFGNASVKRRNHRYEIDIAVYEKPVQGGQSYKMPTRQIYDWVRHAAAKAHPRLYKRIQVDLQPWTSGRVSRKLYAPLHITVDATPSDVPEQLVARPTGANLNRLSKEQLQRYAPGVTRE